MNRFNNLLFVLLALSCSSSSTSRRSIYNDASYVSLTSPATALDLVCGRSHDLAVAIDPKFNEQQRQWIIDSLPYLSGLNINAYHEQTNPSITILSWKNLESQSTRCRNHRIGEYRGTNFIWIDPECSETQQQFMATIVHEIEHWLGMRHVCREDGRTSDTCSPVGRGLAVINPYLTQDHPITPTLLDLVELDRVFLNNCISL